MFKGFLFFILIFPLSVWASNAAPEEAMSFEKWKDSQIIEAQNNVVRLSNNLLLIRSEKYNTADILPEVASESKEEDATKSLELLNNTTPKGISLKEKELEAAIARLEVVRELVVEDYFAVYLTAFHDRPEAISALAEKLKTSEVAMLIQTIIKLKNNDPESVVPPNPAIVSELSPKLSPQKL